MKKQDAFPSQNFRASDITRPIVLTIAGVEMVGFQDGSSKPAMTFAEGGTKRLVLNATNWNECEEAFGDDTDMWVGESVRLSKTKVMFKGERVDSLRLSPITKESKDDSGNEDIPF